MDNWLQRNGLFAKMLLSGVGAILVTSLLWIGTSIYFLGKSSRADQVRSLTNHLVIGLYKTRNLEKNILLRDVLDKRFYVDGTTEGVAAYLDSLRGLKDIIASLAAIAGRQADQVADIEREVTAYGGIFEQLMDRYRQLGFGEWGAYGDWHRAGHELQDQVLASGQFRLVLLLNEVLHAEREYLLLHDVRITADIRAKIAEMRAASETLAPDRRLKLQAALDGYLGTLGKHQTLLEEIGINETQGLQARYRAAVNAVDPLAAELLAHAVDQSHRYHVDLYQANVGVAVLGLLLGGLLFSLLSRTVTRPLRTVTDVAEKVASGRIALGRELEGEERTDEIGSLLQSFRRMVASLGERAALAGRIAEGDLTGDLGDVKEDDVLGTALKAMTQTLKNQVREIKEGVNVLGSSSSEISSAVTQVTASATETATAVTQTMATAEELRQTSELSSQKAGTVSKTAAESAERSTEGQEALAGIVRSMDEIRNQMEAIGASVVALSEQGQVIGEIIGTVDDLAEQSSILSVNASIEAAKAGEQGRGFAVVAQEIKTLAEKSKEGTARVRSILADIQKATSSAVMVTEQGAKAVEAGVAKADEAAKAMGALGQSIVGVDQAAMQILASSKQQLSGVEQVTAAIENIRDATEQNMKSMEQLDTAALTLVDIGRKIVGLVERYKL